MLIQHFRILLNILVGRKTRQLLEKSISSDSHERYLLFGRILRFLLDAVLVLVVLYVQIDAVTAAEAYVLIANRSEAELLAQAAAAGELPIDRLGLRIDREISPFDRLVTCI